MTTHTSYKPIRMDAPETRKEFQQLLKTHKEYKIIIKAYAKWCKPCSTIETHVYDLFQKLSIQNKMLLLLDVDRQQDLASYLKIRALPTIITYVDGMKEHVVEGVDIPYITHLFKDLEK